MNHSRKRPRSCDDEACELMPISKRINDLHIRSGFPEIESSAPGFKSHVEPHIQIKSSFSCATDLTKESFEKNSFHNRYEPELSVVENPYYYQANEVLFQAHMQRIQRLSRGMS